MSDTANVSAHAISGLLTGLAGAMTDAQQLMSETPPSDVFGRPLPTYQIPHLDFTFEIETVSKRKGDGSLAGVELRPTAKTGSTESITSTISGRMVSVPPNGGLPRTTVQVTQAATSLNIQLLNTAGEVLPGAVVELEFDAEASAALYDTTLPGSARLQLLSSQQVTTDVDGAAVAGIDRTRIPDGKQAVILVRGGGAETRVAVAGGV
jgi:hypothetical protein